MFNLIGSKSVVKAFWSLSLAMFLSVTVYSQSTATYDIVIYGGTSAGVVAAVQAKKMGKTVVLIEPTDRLGGLTTGGLGQTDIGNKRVIGGLSREFYERVAQKYQDPANWKWQKKEEYKSGGQSVTQAGETSMWTFEPSIALEIFHDLISEYEVPVVYKERLDMASGVTVVDGKIQSIRMESGKTFTGKVFIDTSYEGDLMAFAGVSYTVGRESNAKYNETLSGVQVKHAKYHQFPDGVDPYIRRGDPSSGLLPNVNPDIQRDGTADSRVQAYCFRMCITDVPENRIAFKKPEGYNELEYELLFRAIEAGAKAPYFIPSDMPNRKTDWNNRGPFSTDYIGRNYSYPEGDYDTRQKIIEAHKTYQLGLMWTLANHPRIPENIRKEISRWGLPKDEYQSYGNWSPQLYVREVRRMVSDFVMTENHCYQKLPVKRSIGMGAYTMDSHHVQRYVTKEGFVKNEGDVEVGGFGPYPIDYGAIVPKRNECSNLLVPVCPSASHMAFGSMRMEPVFMILGQSAATAASLAIDARAAVQDVNYKALKHILLRDKQVLTDPR